MGKAAPQRYRRMSAVQRGQKNQGAKEDNCAQSKPTFAASLISPQYSGSKCTLPLRMSLNSLLCGSHGSSSQ